MGIYEGYQEFKRKNGVIRYVEESGGSGYLKFNGMNFKSETLNYVIEVKSLEDREDQIKTLIHELLHLSRKYKLLLGTPADCHYWFAEKLHKDLEQEALNVYQTQPVLVAELRKKLEALDVCEKRDKLKVRILSNVRQVKFLSDLECRILAMDNPLLDPLYLRLSELYRAYNGIEGYDTFSISLFLQGFEERTIKESDYNEFYKLSRGELKAKLISEPPPDGLPRYPKDRVE